MVISHLHKGERCQDFFSRVPFLHALRFAHIYIYIYVCVCVCGCVGVCMFFLYFASCTVVTQLYKQIVYIHFNINILKFYSVQ